MWNWFKKLLHDEPPLEDLPLPPPPSIHDAEKAAAAARQAKLATARLRQEQKRLSDAYVEAIMTAIADKAAKRAGQ